MARTKDALSADRANMRDVTWLLSGRVLQLAVSMPIGILNAWVLGPAILGALKIIETIAAYALRSDLGMMKAYAREVAIQAGRGDMAAARHTRNVAFSGSLLSTLVVIAGLAVAYALGFRMGGAIATPLVLLLTGVMLITNRISVFLDKHISADGRFVAATRIQLWLSILKPIVSIPLMLMFGLSGVVLGLIVLDVLQIGMVLRAVRLDLAFAADRREGRRLVDIGFSIFLLNSMGEAFWSVEIVLLPMFLSLYETGLFGFALAAVNVARSVPESMHGVFFRNMALDRGQHGTADAAYLRRYLGSNQAAYALLSAAMLGVAYLGYRFLTQVLLSEFAAAIDVLLVLTFGMMLYQARVFGSYILNLLDEFRTLLQVQGAMVAINIALDLFLIWKFGLMGAAVGACLGFAVGSFMFTVTAGRRLYDGRLAPGLAVFGKMLAGASSATAFLALVPSRVESMLSFGALPDVVALGLCAVVSLGLYLLWILGVFLFVFRADGLTALLRGRAREVHAALRGQAHLPVQPASLG